MIEEPAIASGSGNAGTSERELARPGLHVVECVDGLFTGGAQVLMGLRARHRHQANLKIEIISFTAEDLSTLPMFEAENIRVHLIPGKEPDKTGDLRRIRQTVALLRKLRPDVVHTHLRSSNIIGTLAARLAAVPSVASLHNVFPEPNLASPRRDWGEQQMLDRFARGIIAVGPKVAETHQPRFLRKTVEVLPNPVELPLLDGDRQTLRQRARRELSLPFEIDDSPWLLGVGRLSLSKDFALAIDIIQELKREVPDVKLLIAGDGKQEAALIAKIREEGLQNTVWLLGRSEHVSELMFASDAFLLSSNGEGLPLVLLEAMARRLPIVATRVGDVPFLLGNGEFGLLFDHGDVAGGREALATLLGDAEKADQFAERALERVKAEFSVDQWMSDTRGIYLRASGR